MKKLLFLPILLAAAYAWGFNEAMPPGESYFPEQSQETLAQQQQHVGRYDEVGTVPRDTDLVKQNPNYNPDHSATATLNQVNERESARANISRAEERMQSEVQTTSSNWWKYLIFFAVIGGALFFARRAMDNMLPNMPKKTRVRW